LGLAGGATSKVHEDLFTGGFFNLFPYLTKFSLLSSLK